MAEQTGERAGVVTVRELSGGAPLGLELEVLEGHEGLGNEIVSPRIQKLGLALAGFTGYIHTGRVQVIGGSEMNYLRMLGPSGCGPAIRRLHGQGISCIVVTRGIRPPDQILELGRQDKIPVLLTPAPSSVLIAKISDYLEERLAPRTTIHGVLLEIFGLGVLLLGPSGIGKSECALELVLKGHRLVADDYVVITRRGLDRLVGAGSEVLKHHMELRGLGIIDIRELFGISATGASQNLDFVVRLERWRPEAEYDRLGLEQSEIEFLGISIPLIEMPVAPGRNISALIEVAARIRLLKKLGYAPSNELRNMEAPPSGEFVGGKGLEGSKGQP
jgi:HPr kinase/phosphorylase